MSEQLCFALYSAAHAMGRVYRPILSRIGLTYPQYLVMLVLWEADGATVGSIGGQLGLDSNTVTPLIKRLEALGYLARERDTSDERVVRVRLTPEGRALRDRAAEIPADFTCATGLTLGDAVTFRDRLQAMRNTLDTVASRTKPRR